MSGDRGGTIAVVSMPWATPEAPSLQIGLLTALAGHAGLPVTAHSLHLAAAEQFVAGGVGVGSYEAIAHRWWTVGLGEWIFAGRVEADAAYHRYLVDAGVPDDVIDAARTMRGLVPRFLDQAADEILAGDPGVVGFTTTFSQTLPSLALAGVLKARRPDLFVVLGGSGCDGAQGEALLRCFDQVDLVFRGEAEPAFAALCAELLAGRVPATPGLLARGVAGPTAPVSADLSAAPIPDYYEFFDRLAASPLRDQFRQPTRLVMETSRGCWWGERHHCKFCGLNGSTMAFRSKPAPQAVAEIDELARRHHCVDFDVVDNILSTEYFETVLPVLAERRRAGLDYTFFYETKANLVPSQVRALRDAGVVRIQPGIESLRTSSLRRVDKGVTALQNIRLLVFAARYELNPTWNIIYGLPGETAEDYAAMAELVPSLVHLKPPGLVRLQVHRFSPYFDDPGASGLRLVGPAGYYRHLYDVGPADLADLAYCFDYEHVDGHDADADVAALRTAVEGWDAAWSPGRHHSLRYERGPGYLRLLDRRRGRAGQDIRLDDIEALLYLSCLTGATATAAAGVVSRERDVSLEPAEVERFFADLVEARVLYREGEWFLALALPMTPDAEPPPILGAAWRVTLAAR